MIPKGLPVSTSPASAGITEARPHISPVSSLPAFWVVSQDISSQLLLQGHAFRCHAPSHGGYGLTLWNCETPNSLSPVSCLGQSILPQQQRVRKTRDLQMTFTWTGKLCRTVIGAAAEWKSSCLASTRSWVQSSAKKDKMLPKHTGTGLLS